MIVQISCNESQKSLKADLNENDRREWEGLFEKFVYYGLFGNVRARML